MSNSDQKKSNIRVSQRVPESMGSDLKALAQQLGIRRAEIVRRALAQFIEQQKTPA